MQKRKRSSAAISTRRIKKRRVIKTPLRYAPPLERKFYDTSLVAASITSPTDSSGGEVDASATVSACTIAQGDGESQRDGRKANVLSVHYKGIVRAVPQVDQTAADSNPTIFIAMVLDKQTNGTQFSSEEVFTNPSGSGLCAPQVMLNLQQSTRFKVLKTWKYHFNDIQRVHDGTNIEQGGSEVPFDLYQSFGTGLPIIYKGTTASIANISDNSVHLVAYSSNTGLACTITYNCRTRFVG